MRFYIGAIDAELNKDADLAAAMIEAQQQPPRALRRRLCKAMGMPWESFQALVKVRLERKEIEPSLHKQMGGGNR
ncbi:MAG: hypothetical protein KKE29_20020 [Proteobacteria bacterium]|nr:hypothetical protein [Pseudomonadota bacterium]MBU4576010.1 hypothetical protein [Pseudomonadota bacterium]MBV1715976.1 hypothetical protein [Desulfarculus sp.]